MNNQDETQDERLLLMSHPTVTFVTHSCAARIVLPAQRNCQDEFEARQWFTRQEPRELLFARLLPTWKTVPNHARGGPNGGNVQTEQKQCLGIVSAYDVYD